MVDGFHLLRARDQTGLVATFAKLVDRNVLQLWQVDFVAQEVQLLAAIRVLPLLVFGQRGDVLDLALVQPFDEQLECGWIFVEELNVAILEFLVLSVDTDFLVEVLRVVDEQISVQRPLAPVCADVDGD